MKHNEILEIWKTTTKEEVITLLEEGKIRHLFVDYLSEPQEPFGYWKQLIDVGGGKPPLVSHKCACGAIAQYRCECGEYLCGQDPCIKNCGGSVSEIEEE